MRRVIVCAISGAVLVLAFPPFNIGAAAWVAFVPLFFALEGANWKHGLASGYAFGLAFFLGTVYWVIHSMYYYGGIPAYISVLAMFSLAAYLAVYPGLFGLLAAASGRAGPWVCLLLVPALWTATEFARGRLFTGLPWVLAGYSQAHYLPVVQVADITGVWGVSYLVVFVNAAVYLGLRPFVRKDSRFPARAIAAAVAVVAIVLVYGFVRISEVDSDVKGWPFMRAAVAQGSIDQSVKWDKSFQKETLDIYRGLTLKAARDGATLVVWPETAVPFFFDAERIKNGEVGSIARDSGSYLLTGAPSYNYNRETGKGAYYNSAYLVSPSGDPVGRYDKTHLVPFGEYVPLKRLFPFFEKLTAPIGDFSEGPGALPMKFEDEGIGTLICYESIFPSIAAASVRNGSTLLVNITNDAWFGRTAAPYQHFEMAILRAVENRVFLLRAANTGVSGIIGPAGRVMQSSGLFEKTVLVGRVGFRRGTFTPYTRYGDVFAWGCVAASFIFIATGRRKRR